MIHHYRAESQPMDDARQNGTGLSSRATARLIATAFTLLLVFFAIDVAATDIVPRSFHPGESFRYKLGWAAFAHAADVKLDFVERRDLYGQPTMHFQAALHSVAPLRTLFPVDDVFDSYSDAKNFDSRQYEFHLSELGEKEERIRHLASSGAVRTSPGPHVIVPAGTRDPLGVLYEMRTIDWKRTPNYRAPMYDGNNVFEVQAELEVPDEMIAIDAGNFHTMRIDAHLYQRGVRVQKTELSIWLENDAARTPLLLDATMPYGKIRAELQPKVTK
ncbi:MAG: DUF3108 domain-containing protein [Candidatus Acidiferrales bacterium]